MNPAPASHPWPTRWLTRCGRALATLLVVGLAACGPLPPAQAQSYDDDPPARVGRVASVDGPVWLESAGGGEAIASPRNWPISGGDVLSTGERGRTDLGIGSTRLRVDENTRLRVLRLDDDAVDLELQRGSLALRFVNTLVAREFRIVTAAGQVLPLGDGLYRVDADLNGRYAATAWRDDLLIQQGGLQLQLRAGQRADLYVEGGWRIGAPQHDSFARWAERLDDMAVAGGPAPIEMTGVETLSAHGDWITVEEWGPAWFPRVVASDWAPFRYGHWAWVAPWGWTWIDDAPWGFAPSHYGRWMQHRGRWCWLPGAPVARPVYAPALVIWAGSGGHAPHRPPPAPPSRRHTGPLIGHGISWQPLPPQHHFTPDYRHSDHHQRDINRPFWRDGRPAPEWLGNRRDERDEQRRDDRQRAPIQPPGAPGRFTPAPTPPVIIAPQRPDRPERPGRAPQAPGAQQPTAQPPGFVPGFRPQPPAQPAPAVMQPAPPVMQAPAPQPRVMPAPAAPPPVFAAPPQPPQPPAMARPPQPVPPPQMAASSPGGDVRRTLPIRRGRDDAR